MSSVITEDDKKLIIEALRAQVRHDDINLPYLYKDDPASVESTRTRMHKTFGLIIKLKDLWGITE